MNEQLKIIITASADGAVQGAKKAEKAMKDMGKNSDSAIDSLKGSLGKIGTAIAAAFTVDAIIGFTQELVNCGAEIAAEEAAFAQIMGDYAGTATEKLRAISDETGIAEGRLTSGMTSMTAKWQGLGLGIDDATTKASEGLTIAADAAAFWDMSLEESQSHLNSFINGSYEGGEAIGLFANDTQMALYAVEQGLIKDTKEWANLDEATKQATRLDYAKNMQTLSGVVGQASKESGSFANVQANLNRKWQEFKGAIGEDLINQVLIPAMEDLQVVVDEAAIAYEEIKTKIGEFKDKLGEVKDFCEEHKVAIEVLASAFGVLTTAIVAYNIAQAIQAAGGIASVASLAATAIGVAGLTVAETVATVATTAFGAALAFLTSPVTLVVAAIAAVIAIVVLCVKHWDDIKAAVGKAVDAINKKAQELSQKVQQFFNNMKDKVNQTVGNFTKAVKDKFEEIKNGIKEKIESAKNTVSNVFNAIKTTISNAVKNAFDTVKSRFDSIKTTISNVVNGAKSVVSTAFNTIKTKIANGVSGAFNSVKSKFDAIKDRISNVMNSVKDKVQSAIDRIKSIFNITLKFPDIRVPSIRVTGGKMPWGLAGKGVPPNIDIVWHAKGGVFDSPTLFGYNGAIHGLGEAGAEAIVPLEDDPKWIKAIAKEMMRHGSNRPIILQIDKKVIAEEVVDGINDLTRQRGSLPLRVM